MDYLESFFEAGREYWANLGSKHEWVPIVVALGAWLSLVGLILWLKTRIDYRIGKKYFMVTLLGLPIRFVRLDNIRNLHTRRQWWSERWFNMIFVRYDRILVIEKKRGLIKRLSISPPQRYVFRAELDRAIRNFLGLPPAPGPGSATDTASYENPGSVPASAPATASPHSPPSPH